MDQDGDIYVADWGNERVQVLHSDGRFLDSFRGDAGLSKWSDDYFKANQDELEERQKADMEPELDLWPDDGPRGGVGQHREAVLGAYISHYRRRGQDTGRR